MAKTRKALLRKNDWCAFYQVINDAKTGKPFESYEACKELMDKNKNKNENKNENKNKKTDHYKNTEVQKMKGGKIVREVSVKNGKGFKKITRFQRGRKVGSVKKALPQAHVTLILNRRFIPGLFSDCHPV